MMDGPRPAGEDATAVRRHQNLAGRKRSFTTAGLLLGAVALLASIPACTSAPSTPVVATTTTTPTTTSVTLPDQNPAEIATCTADAQGLQTALAAYQAEHGAYPSPPEAWSAATYAANYQPLTAAGNGGPFMPSPPKTTSYVIEYDSSGHVWVAPPGTYRPYNRGQDISVTPSICDAAVE